MSTRPWPARHPRLDVDETRSGRGLHPRHRKRPGFSGSGQDAPGGLYANTELHAGLICLNSARQMDLSAQRELFEIALKELSELPDLINQVLEVIEEGSGEVVVTLYELPSMVDEGPKED